MSINEFAETLNEWGGESIPFLFLVDFEMKKPVLFRIHEIDRDKLLFDLNGVTNSHAHSFMAAPFEFVRFPVTFPNYEKKYETVRSHLAYGDSYLTNLTIKTRVTTSLSLKEIFVLSKAKYKLWFEEQFLVFSPETFVVIRDGKIFTHPMKGTIDASVPRAKEIILSDGMEMAEHVTIVDLLRNDLSQVASDVQVTRFRYVEEIKTMHKDLLQVSSEIMGVLPADYKSRLGDILVKLLPAGSVCGAPKPRTVEIIQEAEKEPRGYYTGIMGIFDGNELDSGVMIRFMEKDGEELYYRSGGGITMQSVAETEYQEAIDKVYVPLH